MEKEKNTAHETVDEKVSKAAAKAAEEVKEAKAAEKTEKSEAESPKEGLNDSDMIDINKESEEKKKEEPKPKRGYNGHKAPKNTEDFIAKQKKRKKIRKLITLAIVALIIIGIVLWVKNAINKTKEAFAGLAANNVQTSYVEKKTLYDSKDATGTLYALESRTISRSLQGSGTGGAQIEAINVEVGDHVSVGDVLVEFSSENIEETIARKKEDIGTQKKLDALTAEDKQREYVYSYSKTATSMRSSAESVEKALKELYEACDAYGDAKRKREDVKNMSDEDIEKEYGMGSKKSVLESLDREVATAYQAEQAAQEKYDHAVESQADSTLFEASNSLSNADSAYKQAQINSGERVKTLTRDLNDAIDSLDDYVVYATIDGVVTDVNVSEGNTFTSGNVLTIQDDSGYKAEVLIDEYDIPKVKKAYEEKKAKGEYLDVVVKTDATGDNEYKGHVTLIAPTSTSTTAVSVTTTASSGGVTSTASSGSTANYKVSIELDDIDEAFMIGMSAKVAIVVDQSPENSLCIPYNCVEKTDDGKYIVKVMDEHGDKSTADDMMPNMGNMGSGPDGKRGNRAEKSDDSKGVNGIVIENDADSDNNSKDKPGKKDGLLSKLFGKDKKQPVETGRKYREVEVDKIFDTDYYAAVIPKVEGSLKEGDEVMVVTEKASGNDIMAMFGGPGGF